MRRVSPNVRPWLLAAAACAAIDAAFLGDALFTSRVRCSGDLIAAAEPFRSERAAPPSDASNPWLHDWAVMFHPWMHEVRAAYFAGRVPLWNPHSALGVPLAANFQSEAFSPFLPIALAAGDQQADWRQLAQLVVAQCLTLALARALGLGALAACVAAISYSFSSYMQCWALHPPSASAAFAPGVWLGLVRLRERFSVARVATCGAVVGLSLLAGHVETAAMVGAGGTLAVLLATPSGADRRDPPPGRFAFLGSAAAAGLLGVAASSIALLPFLGYLGESPIERVRQLAPHDRIPLGNLVTLLDPSPFRPPWGAGRAGSGLGNVLETGLFAGRIALALALIGAFVPRPWRAAMLVTAAVGLAIACGPDWMQRLLAHAPPFDRTASRRWSYLALLPIALLAGSGLDALRARRMPAALAAALVAAAALDGAVVWKPFVPVVEASDLHPASRALNVARALVGNERCLPAGSLLPPNLQLVEGLASVRSYDAIGFSRTLRALVQSGAVDDPLGRQEMETCDPRVLDLMAVRWLLTPWPAADAPQFLQSQFVDGGASLDVSVPAPMEGDVRVLVSRAAPDSIDDGTVTRSLAAPVGEAIRTEPDAALADWMRLSGGARQHAFLGYTPERRDSPWTLHVAVAAGAPRVVVSLVGGGGFGREIAERAEVGGVHISERTSALPRAYLAPAPRIVEGADAALAAIADPGFDAHRATILDGAVDATAIPTTDAPAAPVPIAIEERSPEEIVARFDAPARSVLVVADSFARGWRATVDGEPAPILAANAVGRAVVVPAGSHELRMVYAPAELAAGAWITAAAWIGIAAAHASTLKRRRAGA